MAKEKKETDTAPAPAAVAPAPRVKTVEVGCPKCEASGHFGDEARASDNPFCPDCKGRGKITVPLAQSTPCTECNGRGHVENVPCFPCAHTGKRRAGSNKAA